MYGYHVSIVQDKASYCFSKTSFLVRNAFTAASAVGTVVVIFKVDRYDDILLNDKGYLWSLRFYTISAVAISRYVI